MSRYFKYPLFLLLFLFIFLPSFSQDKQSLEKKKKKIKEDIEYTNQLLNQTSKDIKISSTELAIINTKINYREKLIAAIRSEMHLLEKQIDENQMIITAMENDLHQLKDEYAQLMVEAYKNRNSYDKLMFIFSADDFNQAYKRLKYFQQYAQYRQNQADLIKKTQEILNEKNESLEGQKAEKKSLLSNESQEKQKLHGDKTDQQTAIKQLQSKEKQLKTELKKKQKEAKKLEDAIRRIIEEEIKKAKEKGGFVLTPEAAELMGKFERNKGNLPWPLEKGLVTGKFGKQKHPVLGIDMNNNGIDLSTTKGAKARAVFEGEVSKVVIIPGSGKAVLVRHGEYLSVYFKLKEVYVQPGDKIKIKDEIGNIITDSASGKTELHFEVWKGKTILNPSDWLYQAQ
ncbi:MAG: peptidase M23 [Flavobacteriales bacterium]|nr:MAG: peptidase M23 [Flavobacteriales bacterium]